MNITDNCLVTISYKIYSLDKELLYSSDKTGNIIFKYNSGRIMKGIEEAVTGKSIGFSYSGIVAAKKAFGEYEADHVIPYHKNHFKHMPNLKVGDYITFDKHNCRSQEMKVIDIVDETIVADANHKHAGDDIYLEFEVIDVKESLKEISTSGCGGCGH